MDKGHSNDTWLEPALRRHLTRVPAPPDLWPRRPLSAARPSGHPWGYRWVWILATAASLLAVAWGYHPYSREIHSASATDIRAWVQGRTGLRIPLAPDASIQLQSARIVNPDIPTVEVRYQVAGHHAVLLITKSAPDGTRPHGTGSSWTMARQTYTLTSTHPEGLRPACLVCHTATQL